MSYRLSLDNLTLSIKVWDRAHRSQHTVARTQLWIELADHSPTPNTHDILEYIEQHAGKMNINEIPSLLKNISTHCVTQRLGISLQFPYFRSKATAINAQFDVQLTESSEIDFVLRLGLNISGQRHIDVAIRSEQFIWIETLEETLVDLPILPPNLLQTELQKRLAQFQPSWAEVHITELKEGGLTLSHQWSWDYSQQSITTPVSKPTPRSVQSFGIWLKDQRIHRHLSQQQLARSLQISNSNLSRIESGLQEPTLQMLTTLAQHWSYSLDHLLLRARHPSKEMLEALAKDIDGFLHWMSAQ